MKPLRFWVCLFRKLLEPIKWNSIHYLLVVKQESRVHRMQNLNRLNLRRTKDQ